MYSFGVIMDSLVHMGSKFGLDIAVDMLRLFITCWFYIKSTYMLIDIIWVLDATVDFSVDSHKFTLHIAFTTY